MGFTEEMRCSCSHSWHKAIDHTFVKELKQKTLPADVFAQYLLQDYAFMAALLSAFGHALAEAPSLEAKKRLSAFIQHVCTEELEFFYQSFKDLNICPEVYEQYGTLQVHTGKPDHPRLTHTTQVFRDLLLSASREGYAQALAVIVPSEWIYLEWASRDGADTKGNAQHRQQRQQQQQQQEPGTAGDAWVELHTNRDFSSFVEWLRSELDREAEKAGNDERSRLSAMFAQVVDLEKAFFDAAYTPN